MSMDRSDSRRPARRAWPLKRFTTLPATLLACLLASSAAADALVAVATNFTEVAEVLETGFEAQGYYELIMTSGSTGKLYAQIIHGAPFDVLLAADSERPRLLIQSGHAEEGSRFTYALGRLTLWSRDPDAVAADGRTTLRDGNFRSLALANPSLAPYGAAAKQALNALGLWDILEGKMAMGENVGQAYALVATGNAELGLVALSAAVSPRNLQRGSRWDLPADLYAPIRQDAVLLKHGADNAVARAFLQYLQSDAARATIRSFGYGIE